MQRILIMLALMLVTAGCGFLDRFIYRMPTRQGNIVEAKQWQQLRYGMSRKQVAFIMGTPLVVDTFSQDRWDYVYYERSFKGEVKQQRITLYFAADRLIRLDSDISPAPVLQH